MQHTVHRSSRPLPAPPSTGWLRAMGAALASPQALLVLATLFWAGNFIVGRLVRQDLSPIALTFWRWAIALPLLLALSSGEIRRHRRLILARWRLMVGLGATGIAAYSVSVYEALRATTAINASLFAALLPLTIVLAGRLFNRDAIARRQLLGMLISLLGALVIVSHGEPAALLALRFNPGDLWMLLAVPLWAVYAILQKRRPPQLSPLTLVTVSVAVGVALLAPCYLWELAQGVRVPLTAPNLIAIGYVAVVSSAIGYVLWNRGAATLGPIRAGVYTNLIPVFSATLAVLLLGEALAGYHLVGAALVAAGIYLASRRFAAAPSA
jgi:drug/metabolite transporter (DMT)-like permease